MKRNEIISEVAPECPIRNVLARIADKGSLLVLYTLENHRGPMRFSLLQKQIPDVSQKKMIVEQTNCEGCGTCMSMCESEALFFNKDGLAQIDESRCLTCGYCAPVCPSRAIILY